jgi:hypothetical protein
MPISTMNDPPGATSTGVLGGCVSLSGREGPGTGGDRNETGADAATLEPVT